MPTRLIEAERRQRQTDARRPRGKGMELIQYPKKQSKPLRAIVEIDGGELRVYPVADNDADEAAILDALRFIRADFDR